MPGRVAADAPLSRSLLLRLLPCPDFSCAWDHKVVMHGRMYVTERRLCFYANFFGLEAKMSLR